MTYAFSNSADEAIDQLDSLERFLDPVTTRRIAEIDLRSGARCWEIGAGAGSIAAWLAAQAGPTGEVVATDINTDRMGYLHALDNVLVVRHDITTLAPPLEGEPYDLIHARLVLLHLPQREHILRSLVTHLAPGAWLLVEELDWTAPLPVHASASTVDTELFGRVTAAIVEILESGGADMAWAQAVDPVMRSVGLVDVHTVTYRETWTGGRTGARLHDANSRLLAARLNQGGVTPAELDRFRDIVADPRHTAGSYLFVSTRGRRPHADLIAAVEVR
jgi:trans-aconitate methyltransferase